MLRVNVLLLALVLCMDSAIAIAADKNPVEMARKALKAFISKDNSLQEDIDQAGGYAVFPRVGKVGMAFGGARGTGVVFQGEKAIGSTSLTQLSFGFQMGAQVYSELILFEDEEALAKFQESNFGLSAQYSNVMVAGGQSGELPYAEGMKIITMTKAGMMYEAAVGGQKFSYDPFVEVSDSSFVCLNDMELVRDVFVANLLDDLDASVKVAESTRGGRFPPGTVLQIVPSEAMVKRSPGTSKASGDWEFFTLDVSANGTTITSRGFADVVNQDGESCLGCHKRASRTWDSLCAKGHGCDASGMTAEQIASSVASDPRCKH